MASLAGSPKRLFWLILLALLIPWAAVGTQFGFCSRKFWVSITLSIIAPVSIMTCAVVYGGDVPADPSPFVVLAVYACTTSSLIYAIYNLVMERYSTPQSAVGGPIPLSDVEAGHGQPTASSSSEAAPPPYDPSSQTQEPVGRVKN